MALITLCPAAAALTKRGRDMFAKEAAVRGKKEKKVSKENGDT